MGQILHGSATTTEAVRRATAISNHQSSKKMWGRLKGTTLYHQTNLTMRIPT